MKGHCSNASDQKRANGVTVTSRHTKLQSRMVGASIAGFHILIRRLVLRFFDELSIECCEKKPQPISLPGTEFGNLPGAEFGNSPMRISL